MSAPAVITPPFGDQAVSAPAVPDEARPVDLVVGGGASTGPLVRLRPGVLALPTPAGISFLAPAMGAEASLVMEGPVALHQLWALVAAAWQDGVPETALDDLPVPDGARRVLRHWWDELTARGLMVPADRLLAAGGSAGPDAARAVCDRLDASAADPVQAWSALRRGRVVLVGATDDQATNDRATDGVLRSLARALETGGVGSVELAGVGTVVSGGSAGSEEVRLVVDLGDGVVGADLVVLGSRVVVADPAREPGDDVLSRVREALALRGEEAGGRTASTVQLALGVAALAQRTIGLLAGLPDPHRGEVMVVEDDGPVVRYARPVPVLGGSGGSGRSGGSAGSDGTEVPDALDRVLDGEHWLSDEVLGPIEMPSPGDLEQVPSPRAQGRVLGADPVLVHGLGETGREARVEVALTQLAVLAARDGHSARAIGGSVPATVVCRGRDRGAMVADALTRLLLTQVDDGARDDGARDNGASDTDAPGPHGTRVHVVDAPTLHTGAAASGGVALRLHLVTVRRGPVVVAAATGVHRAETVARAVGRATAALDSSYDLVPRPVLDPIAADPDPEWATDWTGGPLAALAAAGVLLRIEPTTHRGHSLPGVAHAHLERMGSDR